MDSKLQGIFAEVLGLPADRITDATSVDTEAEWDSLRHMNLIFAIEDGFGVRFDDEEIASLTSVGSIDHAIKAKKG